MTRYTLIAGLSVLALSAGPAFAQTAPAQGTVQPRHVTHPAPAHKMPRATAVNADRSADDLNAKELASIQHGSPAPATTPPAPAKTP
ncbi:MAG TPA: hypothetical protein VGI78_07565 [Acetobacteraceae bacterium]|jgi:hypothetical protein